MPRVLLWFGLVRNRSAGYLLLSGLFLGLGVFNKIDLLVFISALGIAGLVFYAGELWQAVSNRWWVTLAACFAFLVPSVITLPRMGKVIVVAEFSRMT